MAFHPYPQLIRKLFNVYRCGPPRCVTTPSTWPWVDHQVSRQQPLTTSPCSDSLSLRLQDSSLLTSLVTVTRRLIMQKARCHSIDEAPTACKHPVSGSVSPWYAQSFSPFPHGTLPYRSSTVFSLGRWCCQIQRESLRLPPTQDTQPTNETYPYGTLTPCGWPSQTIRVCSFA